MKWQIFSLLLAVILACSVSSCNKSPAIRDQEWSPPNPVASSTVALGGAFRIYKSLDGMFGVQVTKEGACLVWWNHTSGSWSEVQNVAKSQEYVWGLMGIDAQSSRVLLPDLFVENEQFVMKSLAGNPSVNGILRNALERKVVISKESLLGKIDPTIKLNYHELGRQDVGLGPCMLKGAEAWIPFCVTAAEVTHTGKTVRINMKGPYAAGVFYSSDSGNSWHMDKISNRLAYAPAICKTSRYLYYFGNYSLWFSRKATDASSWESPQDIAQSFARVNGIYDIVGEGDTAHICWMDRRHNKTRINLTGPPIENNDIYYRRWEDGAREWDKEVWLSKGLTYCYAPTISAESNNVVVAWAGIQEAGKNHTDMGPNDIYYVTSKDKGKTWTRPQKVTDLAKDGATCGMPQVLLLVSVSRSTSVPRAHRCRSITL